MRTLESRDFLATSPNPATDKSFPRPGIETRSPFDPRLSARDRGNQEDDELTDFEERLSEAAAASATTLPGAVTSTTPNIAAPGQTESGSADDCSSGAGCGQSFVATTVDTSTLLASQPQGVVEQPFDSLAAPLPVDPTSPEALAGAIESAPAVSTSVDAFSTDDPAITAADTLSESVSEPRKDSSATTHSAETAPTAPTPQSGDAGAAWLTTPAQDISPAIPTEPLVESRHDFETPTPLIQDGSSESRSEPVDLSRLRDTYYGNSDSSFEDKQGLGTNPQEASFRADTTAAQQDEAALGPESHGDAAGHLLRLATALQTPGALENRLRSAEDELDLNSPAAAQGARSDSAETSLPHLTPADPIRATADYRPMSAESPSTPTVAEQLFGEIATRVDLSRREGRIDFRLQLDPPGMGKVHVRLTATDYSISAQLVAEDPAARQALESQMHTLRDSLAGLGVSLEHSGMSREESGGRGGWHWQHPAPPAPVVGMSTPKPAPAATRPQRRLKTSGIDVVG